MVPLLCAGLVWPRRWGYLAQESLLPASRAACVQEIGTGLAIDLASIWFSSTTVGLYGAFLLFPSQVIAAEPRIAIAIVLSAASQPFIFGLIVWSMLLRNAWISFGVLIFLTWGSFAFIALIQVSMMAITIGAIAAVLLGLLITFDAYRRWCQTPLG